MRGEPWFGESEGATARDQGRGRGPGGRAAGAAGWARAGRRVLVGERREVAALQRDCARGGAGAFLGAESSCAFCTFLRLACWGATTRGLMLDSEGFMRFFSHAPLPFVWVVMAVFCFLVRGAPRFGPELLR